MAEEPDEELQKVLELSLKENADFQENKKLALERRFSPSEKENLASDIDYIQQMFPGIDIKYLHERLLINYDNPLHQQIVISEVLASEGKFPHGSYMSKDDILKFLNSDYEKYDIAVTREYRQDAFNFLLDEYLDLHPLILTQILIKFNFHITPTLKYLDEKLKLTQEGIFLEDEEIEPLPLPRRKKHPTYHDPTFISELPYYLPIHQQIIDKQKELSIIMNNDGSLITCPICYNDIIINEFIQCTQGCLVCRDCVRDSIVNGIANGSASINCIAEENCNGFYSEEYLKSILTPDEQRKFDEIIARSMLTEATDSSSTLICCPICQAYFSFIDDKNEKEFRCKNPQCNKITCRLCGEESHTPLPCKKVLEKGEEELRKYVEEKMADAFLHKCPNCPRKCFKEEGCNLITCICKTKFCYLCGAVCLPPNPYNHFIDPPGQSHITPEVGQSGKKGCQLYEKSPEENQFRVKEARIKAEAEWRAMHPEFKDAKMTVKE